VVRRGDDDGIDVLAVEHLPEVAGRELRLLVELLGHRRGGPGHLAVVDVAQRHQLRAGLQHVAEIAVAHAAAANQRDADPAIGPGHAPLRLRRHGLDQARGYTERACRASGGLREESTSCSAHHSTPCAAAYRLRPTDLGLLTSAFDF
jgi:hypothetical protein